MRTRIHGVMLATLLGGTNVMLAQDSSAMPPIVLPPIVLPPDNIVTAQEIAGNPAPAPSILPDGQAQFAPASSRMWFNADFLTQWAKSANAPTIVGGPTPPATGPSFSTAPLPGTGFIGLLSVTGRPGSLNQSNAPLTLAGGDLTGANFGGRFTLGYWLDGTETLGVEAGYSFLVMAHGSTLSANGLPALAIPYTDATTGLPAGYPIAQHGSATTSMQFVNTTPGVFVRLQTTTTADAYSGTAMIRSTGDLQGVEANGVLAILRLADLNLSVTAGLRYVQLQESLDIASNVFHDHQETTVFEPALGLGVGPLLNDFTSIVNRQDQFNTRNSFYGGQVGARGEVFVDRFTLGFGMQLAMGDMNQSVEIAGANYTSTTATATPTTPRSLAGIPLTVPAGPAVTSTVTGFGPTGLFAQPTNIGTYSRDVFALIPQANLRLGYRFSENLTGSIGYSFLYINNVARPGDQIDPAINPGSVAQPAVPGGPARPFAQIHGSDFWVQGIDLGFQLRY